MRESKVFITKLIALGLAAAIAVTAAAPNGLTAFASGGHRLCDGGGNPGGCQKRRTVPAERRILLFVSG